MARSKTLELTREQEELFLLIREWIACRNRQPRLRDLAKELGIVNSAVNARLKALIEKGYIRSEGTARKTRILTILKQESLESELVEIPIFGHIAAGQPIWAEQSFNGSIIVDKKSLGVGNFFALKIKGDSMIEAGINNGDTVIIKQQHMAERGEIIAAYFDGSATLKRFQFENGSVTLFPENKNYEPIPVPSDSDFRILGVFKRVARITQNFIMPKDIMTEKQ